MSNQLVFRDGITSLGGVNRPVKKISSTYTLDIEDYTIVSTGTSLTNVTLLSSNTLSEGQTFIFIALVSAIKIQTTGSDKIDINSSNLTISLGETLELISDGTGNWFSASLVGAQGAKGDTGDTGPQGIQ